MKDGLWDFYDDQQVVKLVARLRDKGLSALEVATELAKDIAARPRSDNVTILLVFFHWSNFEESKKGMVHLEREKRTEIQPEVFPTYHVPIE